MEDKLNTLIAYYEEEKKRLLQLIEEYVKEWEYQLAHFHSKALYQLNDRLQTLKNIQDKFYDEKSFRQNRVENIEKGLNADTPDYMREFLASELMRHKEEIDKLNQLSSQATTLKGSSIFDDILDQLINRKIRSFKLILKRSADLLFEFKFYGKKLKVTLPYVKRHLKNYTLYEDNLAVLERLNFQLTNDNSKLVLVLVGNHEEITSTLKLLLSKIVFEVFYFKEFDNESYIEIKPNVSR